MRRIATHFIWYQHVYHMHYVELDDEGKFVGIYPLTEEISGTEFYDGVLIPCLQSKKITKQELFDSWIEKTKEVIPGILVDIYHLTGLSLSAAKLGTNDSSSDCHIQRL